MIYLKIIKQKDLRELFYINNNGSFRKRLNELINYDEFKEILLCNVNLLNINASDEFFKNKYQIYINNFKKVKLNRYVLLEIGFFSQTTTNINYYLSRGWSIEESKKLLKDRQTNILSAESKKRRANTFSKNYREGKHKKFIRPSQIDYWINKGFNYEESQKQMYEYYSKLSKKFHNKK